MAVGPATLARPAPLAGRRLTLRTFLEREAVFGWLMLGPGVLFLLAFVDCPFFYGIFLSLDERRVASQRTFVGFANFVTLAHDGVFWQIVRNTLVYVAVTTVLKLTGGLGMALVMNQAFRGREPRPRVPAAALHRPDGIVDGRLDVDPRSHVQRRELAARPRWRHHQRLLVPRQLHPGDGFADRRQHLARHALLRHFIAGRAPDDLGRSLRGGRHRWRLRGPAVLVRHVARHQ